MDASLFRIKMKLSKHTLSFVLIVFVLFGCKKFKEKRLATVTINFQTEIDKSNFNLSEKFEDSHSRNISIELIKFYLSDVSFTNKNNEDIITNEIELIELDNTGKAMFEVKIEAGIYSAIKLGIGVPKSLNEANPSDFKTIGHPLNITNNTYWGMNTMYRFVMVDGRYFDNGEFKNTFSYHTGHNESYRTVELTKSFTFEKKESYEETIFLDISKILEGPDGNLDIENKNNYHGNSEDFYLSEQLSDNFSKVFRLSI